METDNPSSSLLPSVLSRVNKARELEEISRPRYYHESQSWPEWYNRVTSEQEGPLSLAPSPRPVF